MTLTTSQARSLHVQFEKELRGGLGVNVRVFYQKAADTSETSKPAAYGDAHVNAMVSKPDSIVVRAFKIVIDEFTSRRLAFANVAAGDAVFMFSKSHDFSGKKVVRILEENGNTYAPIVMPVPIADVLAVMRLSFGGVCQAIVCKSQG